MTELVSAELVATLIVLTIGLIGLIYVRPSLTRTQGGKLLAFIALFVLPIATVRNGFRVHFEATKTTSFCLSCHVMEPYGESLLLADETYLPAAHFQNGLVDRDYACFTCHTQYTLFGDMAAKTNGLKHGWVYYPGRTPAQIELYGPYNNRECLYCHQGGRRFEELHEHDMDTLVSNESTCMECHGSSHDVAKVHDAPKWKDSIEEILEWTP